MPPGACPALIDREQVEHIAYLARLSLTEDEKAELETQLSQILEAFEALSGLDVDDIAPTAQVIPLSDVERPDVVTEALTVEQVLRNAPRVEDDQIRVPPVLDES